jgi:E3 ubiquitin-protein ligase MUL1
MLIFYFKCFTRLHVPFSKVGLLDEEKILPSGKDITAVGMFSFKNGIPEIKSCKDLPYFL